MAVISGTRRTVSSTSRKALTIEGIDDLQKNLALVLTTASGKEMKRVMMGAALLGRNTIRDIAPRGKTGKLKESIFAAYGDANQSNVLLGVNRRIAFYAHMVEFGHAGKIAEPHPFFRPGLTRAAPAMKIILEEGFKKVIEGAPK